MRFRTILGWLLATLVTTSVVAQEEPATGADPTEHIESLDAALDESKTNDDDKRDAAMTAAVGAMDLLTNDYKNYDEKQKKEAVNAIAKVFKFRAKEGEDRLYMAAAAALSAMIPEGEAPLKSAMKVKHLEKRSDVQAILVESLGKHKNPKNVDVFVKLLKESENMVVKAAIQALSEYRDEDVKLRKEIVESLVKEYAGTNNLDLREKGKNPVWRERILAIEVPMNDALAALTLQSFQSAPEWEKWYNDNRSKKW